MLQKELLDIIEKNWEGQVEFLAELVKTPSVFLNQEGEYAVQMLCAEKLKEIGLEVNILNTDYERLETLQGCSLAEWSYEGRPQVISVLPSGSGDGHSLHINGHTDVVPVGNRSKWKHDPFGAQIEDGWMFGRGTGDMKAGVTAGIYAVKTLVDAGIKLKNDVYISTVLEEEVGGNGTRTVLDQGYVGDACACLDAYDKLYAGHFGLLWMRLKVFGRPGHPMEAQNTISALDKANYLISKLRDYEEKMNLPENKHPAFAGCEHPVNLVVGKINGGVWPSMTIEEIDVEMRIGIYPGTTAEQNMAKLEDVIKKACDEDDFLRDNPAELTFPSLRVEGVVTPLDDELSTQFAKSYKKALGRDVVVNHHFLGAADGRLWPLYYGKPSLLYGVNGKNYHGYDECVELGSMKETTIAYAQFIMDWCGVEN